MSNPRDPGAIWDPGRFADYGAGRTRMATFKVHCTAGNDSYGICKNNGLVQWLIPYEGTRWQFAPADALCYDSGPYNTWGPGVEIERPVTGGLIRPGLSEFRDLSSSQVGQLHELFHWLAEEWGFRLDLYDGPRYQCPSDFGGFVNHGDIESQRSDGVTREEWDAIIGGNEVTPEQMAQIGQWLQDMRDSILNNLVGKNRKVGDPGNGYVADWEWDTRVAIDKRLEAIEKKLGI